LFHGRDEPTAECLRTFPGVARHGPHGKTGGRDALTNELIRHGLDLVIGRPIPEKKSGLGQLHLFSTTWHHHAAK
jgi:hypothetical protein